MIRARVIAVSVVLSGAVVAGSWFVQRGIALRAPRGKTMTEAQGARLFDAVSKTR